MPMLQWLMWKTASWVLSLDLNLPSPSQGSVQQPAEHQAGASSHELALLASAWVSRPPSQGASREHHCLSCSPSAPAWPLAPTAHPHISRGCLCHKLYT